MKRIAPRPLLVVLLAAHLGAPRMAMAAEPTRDAAPIAKDDAKREGDAAFDARRFEEAVAAYDRGYAASHNPALLYNRGRSYEAMGRYARALEDFEAFRRDAPEAMRAKVPALYALIDEMAHKVTRLTVTSNVTDARVFVRGREIGHAPLRDVPFDTGEAEVRVEADGYLPFVVTLSFVAGGAQKIGALLTPRAAAPIASAPRTAPPPEGSIFVAPASPSRQRDQNGNGVRTAAFVSGAVAIASLAVAGGFGIAALAQDGERASSVDAHDYPKARVWRDRALASERVEIIAGITGGVTLGTSLVLFMKSRARAEASPSVSAGLTLGGVQVSGSF